MSELFASDTSMEIRAGIAEVAAFDVVGLSIITSKEQAAEDINALWERFFSESTGQYIEGKTDDMIYAVYSDYEGDHEKPYRYTIGYRVNNDQTPDTMHRIHINAQNYALMSAAGKQPQALIDTWNAIWSSDLPRSYATDFELYGPRFFEAGVNEVLIHIGLNEDENQE